MLNETTKATAVTCYHCGQPCEETHLFEDKTFCCFGCQTVYEILQTNNLCRYYQLDAKPGVTQREPSQSFAYLNDAAVRKKLLSFDSAEFARVTFSIPSIHCISCIWLLENLQKLDEGVLRSEVNFARKTATYDFNPTKTNLGQIADTLQRIGYAPHITLEAKPENAPIKEKSLLLKMAVAGFCFGNVMLFSFPEYLGLSSGDTTLKEVFSWLNLALAIPVFFYSGWDYLRSAATSFRQRTINIDVPIAAGFIALFLRSGYDIITQTGPGYLDSFTGLVFFLLVGRWFQGKTYESLAFDRDFTSYFPLAVQRLEGKEWKPVIIYQLVAGNVIQLRNLEIIPADGTMIDQQAYIDYSFVTGESKPVVVHKGEAVYAGGRLIGQPARFTVEKSVSQSHLTSLWSNPVFGKVNESKYKKIIDRAARRFTWIVLGVALITAVYWQVERPDQMWLVLTSVLMVACPCALALAAPFTFGSMLRVFGKHKLYLKNADVIERMAAIDTVVFDKTGTVTHGHHPAIRFVGRLDEGELSLVKSLTEASTHPLSMLITQHLATAKSRALAAFKEIPGRGIQATVDAHQVMVGSAEFVGAPKVEAEGSTVFVSLDGDVLGYFVIPSQVRSNISSMLHRLGNRVDAVLSGDTSTDADELKKIFPANTHFYFNQSPHEKLDYIHNLQENGKTVLMAGDGLNDSGALKQSDVGLAVSDQAGVFTPACDGILDGNKLGQLDRFLSLAKSSITILKIAFTISFFYNAITLGIAVTGHLTPLIAAILMPISSISVVGFASLAVSAVAKRKLKAL